MMQFGLREVGGRTERAEALRLRLGVIAFSTVLLITMIASMHLSTLEISFGSVVYGSPRVWPGHQATLRVAAVDPLANYRTVPIIDGEIVVHDALGERVRHPLAGEGGEIIEVHLPIPEDLQYEARAEVRVVTKFGEDMFTQSLIPVNQPSAVPATVYSHRDLLAKRGRPKQGGPDELRLYPQSGVLVDGLPNRISIWSLHHGEPSGRALRSDSLGIQTSTDEMGLAHTHWIPRPNPIGYSFVLDENTRIVLPAEVEQRQLVVSTERLIVPAGEPLRLTVHSLSSGEPIYIDLWIGDVLAFGEQVFAKKGTNSVDVPTPPDYQGLARVDVYRNMFAPDSSSSSLTLWIGETPLDHSVVQIAETLSTFQGDDPSVAYVHDHSMAFAELALSRTQFPSVGVQLLRTTVDTRLEAVRERKASLRNGINSVFAMTFAFGLLLLTVWSIRHQRRLRTNVRAVADEGISRGEAIDPEAVRVFSRIRHRYELVVVLAGLALAGFSILTLLQTMRWNY